MVTVGAATLVTRCVDRNGEKAAPEHLLFGAPSACDSLLFFHLTRSVRALVSVSVTSRGCSLAVSDSWKFGNVFNFSNGSTTLTLPVSQLERRNVEIPEHCPSPPKLRVFYSAPTSYHTICAARFIFVLLSSTLPAQGEPGASAHTHKHTTCARMHTRQLVCEPRWQLVMFFCGP